jgi:hypothetical protein
VRIRGSRPGAEARPSDRERVSTRAATAWRIARWGALALAIFLVILLRSPGVLLLPSLEAEDGTFVFQHFYVHRDAAEIFRTKSGYVPLVANAIAYASVRLPTRAIPYGLSWLPLLLTIATYTWLFGERYRAWLGSDGARATICLLFALAPIAQWHLLASTDYSIWNTLVLLFFLAATPWPSARGRQIAIWALTNLLVWSHPLTILVAPIFVYRAVRERSARLFHALTLANLALHQAAGVEPGGVFAGMTGIEIAVRLWNAICWTFLVAAATAFRTAFGPVASAWAESGHWWASALWASMLVGLAVVAARRSPRVRTVFGLLAYAIFTVTFFSVMVRKPALVIPLNLAPRYVYVQSLAFLVLFVLLADHYLGARRTGDSSPGASTPWRSRVVMGAIVCWYVALNVQMGYYIRAAPEEAAGRPYLQASPESGRDVRDFFAELARTEDRLGSRDGIYLVLDKPYRWAITVDTRPTAPERSLEEAPE